MRRAFLLLATPLLLAAAPPSPSDIVAKAPAAAWRAVAPENLLVMDLGAGRQVAIELAPDFAPQHVANIRLLTRADWFSRHSAVVRVQENYVVQWGDPTAKAALSPGVVARPEGGYERQGTARGYRALPFRDAYAAGVGHADGWPVATDGKAHWLTHCPAMVGVGRDMPPDTGTGAELYAVIGQGPRHLDRNIALVGRVVSGMEHLSSLPRGTEALGFYKTDKERVPLLSLKLATEMPVAERPVFQVMRTESQAFADWVEARANRRDGFFLRPAGGADICNLMPPVRRAP